MGEVVGRTDEILRRLLKRIATNDGHSDLKKAADSLVHHEWEEVKNRIEFYGELTQLLHRQPLDLKAIKASIDSKGSVLLGGHSSLRAQVNDFIASEDKAKRLIHELIAYGEQVPNAQKIDTFIDQSVSLAFYKKKNQKPDLASAGLFASVLLCAVFPDNFVDFRQDRWRILAKNFELELTPQKVSYSEMLIWAGRVARDFARTPTFLNYFGTDNASWIVAGLAYLLKKEEHLNKLVDEVRTEITPLPPGDFSMEITREMIWDVLQNHNPQVILQGPPGSGKTYLAEQVIRYVARSEKVEDYRLTKLRNNSAPDGSSVIWDIVQFHPSYSYEDFVRGLVTKPTENGIIFRAENRILAEAAELAEKYPLTPVILILDEVNRADLARVLGELLYSMERGRRGEPVASQYGVGDPPDRTLRLPNNLYLIGTMNTADRSIALVDYAIRRRFSFFSVLPKVEIVEEFYRNPDAHCGDKVVAEQLGPKVRALYQAIFGMFDGIRDADDIRIGHSYLLVQGIRNGEPLSEKEWAVSIAFRFAFEVVPMLSEYQKERRLRDGVEEIAVDGQSFSLNLANQNQTRSALEKWLAME